MLPIRAVLLATCLLGTALPAVAAPGRGPQASTPAPAWRHAGELSLDEAVAMVEKRYEARAVRAERHEEDGRTVYRIRLLGADGRVFEVTVDAATGKVE